ncbi:MAG: 3-deoxy-7-phosphoheptulonate synthase [Methylophilaceae bacterium]|nr:3-deoxy-7-phosphoheptulonate synthase [Methylophilaceae bacterium]
MCPHDNSVIDDLHIREIRELIPPNVLLARWPAGPDVRSVVLQARQTVRRILRMEDDRLLVIVGPCSIHDVKAGLEYARRLDEQRRHLADDLFIVMRVYFEKPRTTVGWKGLINDPHLDGSFSINEGLEIARRFLLDVNAMGLPAGSEFLDTITPQYIADLVSWGAIGARTTESQVHRELASGLSCPVGFKNGTDGNVRIAVDAIVAASQPHHFLGVTKSGNAAIVATRGNQDGHLILRGGTGPNYDASSIDAACKALQAAGLMPRVVVDCSHANSRKKPELQLTVASDLATQIRQGEQRIVGVMVESHLREGRQDVVPGKPLEYGLSITDACLGWENTVTLLNQLASAVRLRRRLANA